MEDLCGVILLFIIGWQFEMLHFELDCFFFGFRLVVFGDLRVVGNITILGLLVKLENA